VEILQNFFHGAVFPLEIGFSDTKFQTPCHKIFIQKNILFDESVTHVMTRVSSRWPALFPTISMEVHGISMAPILNFLAVSKDDYAMTSFYYTNHINFTLLLSVSSGHRRWMINSIYVSERQIFHLTLIVANACQPEKNPTTRIKWVEVDGKNIFKMLIKC